MKLLHFLLVGNGPYSNRGCEAIVRGTMAILRREFGDAFRVTLGTFERADIVAKQAAQEIDPLITHVALQQGGARWSLPWWRRQFTRWVLPEPPPYSMLDTLCTDATCALQIGGDNYSLDYGRPEIFMALDNYLKQKAVPVILWGASVGPFEAEPEFAPRMYEHLHILRAIFVRESSSYEYLSRLGKVVNLHTMSDPAFVMEPIEPSSDKIGYPLPPGVIGLNLSPLMAKYITGGDAKAWVEKSVSIVRSVVDVTHRDVLLVPHVTRSNTNDHAFLTSVADACSKARIKNVFCLGGNLSAAEIKWVISRCSVFAGARTHATIAAISSAVPTLSFAYSRKALGLNDDIFGSQEYCLQPVEVSPTTVANRIAALLEQSEVIVNRLQQILPGIRESALHSGAILRSLIQSR